MARLVDGEGLLLGVRGDRQLLVEFCPSRRRSIGDVKPSLRFARRKCPSTDATATVTDARLQQNDVSRITKPRTPPRGGLSRADTPATYMPGSGTDVSRCLLCPRVIQAHPARGGLPAAPARMHGRLASGATAPGDVVGRRALRRSRRIFDPGVHRARFPPFPDLRDFGAWFCTGALSRLRP